MAEGKNNLLASGNRRSLSKADVTRLLAQPNERARSMGTQPASGPSMPSDSMRTAAIAGWAIIGLFFGVFGTWAISAPLNGAVVANGVVKIGRASCRERVYVLV